MNNLNSLLMELLELGSAKVDFMVVPEFLQNNDGTSVKMIPNPLIRINIPDTTNNKNESYNISSYMLPEFLKSIDELLRNPSSKLTTSDKNGTQLSFIPTELSRNGQLTNGYNMSLIPNRSSITQVTNNDIQRLFDVLNQLNIHIAESVLTCQFMMLKNDMSTDEMFNTPGNASQNHGVNSVINSNIIDNINNGNKNNNGDRNKNQTSKSPFNNNSSPYDSNSGSTTSSKNSN